MSRRQARPDAAAVPPPGPDHAAARRLAAGYGLVLEADVAVLLDVRIDTLRAWAKRGRGPQVARIGNARFYDRQALTGFLRGAFR